MSALTVAVMAREFRMTDLSDITFGICSDTHGDALPRWEPDSVVAVLHAGDVYDAPSVIEDEDDPLPRMWVESLGIPAFAVRGSHDYHDPGRFFDIAEDVTGRLREVQPGLWLAGIGFGPRLYYDLPGESDLESQCRDLERLASRLLQKEDRLIVLTHYPPKTRELPCGDAVSSWTYDCIAKLIERLQPVAVVQGHVHEWFGRQWRREETLIVSPGPAGATLSLSRRHGITLTAVSGLM